MAGPSIPDGFDFTDPDLYVHRVPTAEFAELRRAAPVWWNPQRRGASGFDDEGYWVVSKHADVLEVSRDSELYSSQKKTALIRHAQQVGKEALQAAAVRNLPQPAVAVDEPAEAVAAVRIELVFKLLDRSECRLEAGRAQHPAVEGALIPTKQIFHG